MPSANDILQDLAVRHLIGLVRLANTEVELVASALNSADAEAILLLRDTLKESVVGRVRMAAGAEDDARVLYERARVEDTLERIRGLMRSSHVQTYEQSASRLLDLSENVVDIANEQIASAIVRAGGDAGLVAEMSLARPDPVILRALVRERPLHGERLGTRYRELAAWKASKLHETVNAGIRQGWGPRLLARKIAGTKKLGYTDGVLQIGRVSAERLARSSVLSVANAARHESNMANAELFQGLRWVATLDHRTTSICIVRDGVIYTVEDRPRPADGEQEPAWQEGPGEIHWNCRSTSVGVLKSYEELGLSIPEPPDGYRASMNGMVPAKTTYLEWLRAQDEGTLRRVLGPRRLEMMKAGRIPIDRFFSDAGDRIPLTELRAISSLSTTVDLGGLGNQPALIVSRQRKAAVAEMVLAQREELRSARALRRRYEAQMAETGGEDLEAIRMRVHASLRYEDRIRGQLARLRENRVLIPADIASPAAARQRSLIPEFKRHLREAREGTGRRAGRARARADVVAGQIRDTHAREQGVGRGIVHEGGDPARRVGTYTTEAQLAEHTLTGRASDAQLAVWNRWMGTTPEAFLDRTFKGTGLDYSRVKFSVQPRSGEIAWAGDLYHKERKVGSIRRRFDHENARVYHSFFEFNRDFQAGGRGKVVLRNLVEQYEEWGITRVDTHANIDVGSYAWARYGFVPKDLDEWTRYRGDLRTKARHLLRDGDITQDQLDHVLDLLTSDDPKAIWQLADWREMTDIVRNGRRLTVAQALMFHTHWQGRLDFTDPDIYDRFWSYVGR